MRKQSDGERLYFQKLSGYLRQFKGLANNYNQITRAIHKAFTEKKARYLLAELKTITAAMSENMQKVIDLTEQAKSKW